MKNVTLTELVIVVAIIAIIMAIAVPGILSARRSANMGTAISILKSFTKAMTEYQNNDEAQLYPAKNTETKGPQGAENYFTHVKIKNGYSYEYFTNPVEGNASRYIYFAKPINLNNGTKAYYVDELGRIWEASFMELPAKWKEPEFSTKDDESESRILDGTWSIRPQ